MNLSVGLSITQWHMAHTILILVWIWLDGTESVNIRRLSWRPTRSVHDHHWLPIGSCRGNVTGSQKSMLALRSDPSVHGSLLAETVIRVVWRSLLTQVFCRPRLWTSKDEQFLWDKLVNCWRAALVLCWVIGETRRNHARPSDLTGGCIRGKY